MADKTAPAAVKPAAQVVADSLGSAVRMLTRAEKAAPEGDAQKKIRTLRLNAQRAALDAEEATA